MFIKLTSRCANRPIHVRPEDIAMVRFPDHPVDEEDDGMAEITVHGVLGAIPVKETPELIMQTIALCEEMIEKQKVAVPTNGGYGSTGASNLPHCGAGGRVEILNSSIGVNEK